MYYVWSSDHWLPSKKQKIRHGNSSNRCIQEYLAGAWVSKGWPSSMRTDENLDFCKLVSFYALSAIINHHFFKTKHQFGEYFFICSNQPTSNILRGIQSDIDGFSPLPGAWNQSCLETRLGIYISAMGNPAGNLSRFLWVFGWVEGFVHSHNIKENWWNWHFRNCSRLSFWRL